MAKSRILDVVPESRRVTWYHEEDGKTYIETAQDAEPIVEFVSQARGKPQHPDFQLIGCAPETVFNQAVNEGWVHDAKRWRRYFNENSKLRVSGGVI